ncbi:chondroitinase-B domain-containing protein [Bacteroidota bacterium]
MIRRHIHILFLSGLFLLFAKVNLLAEDYYVTNLAEFYSLSDLNPGDVVILKNGVWENAFIEFEGIGTENNPITLKAETAGKVFLTGNSGLEIGGEYLIVDGLVFTQGAKTSGQIIAFRSSSSNHAYHCRLTNTKIIDFNPPSKSTEYKWVSLYGQYNRVDHCHFEGKTHAGAMLVVWQDDQPNYHQIDSNYFGPRPDLGVNGGETIRIGTSDWSMYDSYTIVEGNLFDECDGEIEIISNKTCKNIYRNNTFRNSEGTLTLRHGNECEVYSNFFFGISNKNCGGIRIIGENHKVYNNYLQDIRGSSFRAAISLTNGVPDSPLNRYFQVINAQVVNNTIVNCEHPIVIGAGADSELSLPPKDCFIANNVVADYTASTDQMIEYNDDPENMTYGSNIMYGADLGIPSQSGILEEDPELILSDLWRPTVSSNVIAYGVDTFSYVMSDIDGQSRISTNDVGCDQLLLEDVIYRPLTQEDVGVRWENPIKEVSAADGGQVLRTYIDSAKDGDVIVLTTSGGVYQMDTSAILSADIEIRAKYDLSERPIIEAVGDIDEFILLEENAGLNIHGINFSGGGTSSNTFNSFLRSASTLDENDTLELSISDCQFHDFTDTEGGYLLESAVPAVFDHLLLSDVQIFDVAKQAFLFKNNSHADSLVFNNCTFANVAREVLLMNVASQGDARASLNHCTIDSVGYDGAGYEVLSLSNVDAKIRNSLFTNSNSSATSVTITGANSSLDYCLLWNTSAPSALDGASIGSSIIQDQDVYYSDRSRYYYSLLSVSPALNYANDGENLGDHYWDDHGILSDNAYLSMIELDNTPISGFAFDSSDYVAIVEDPSSYVVTAIKQDTLAMAVIDYPATIPGVCTITVTAENTINTKTYTLTLSSEVGINKEGINTGANSLFFYPNPCEDFLAIESEEFGYALIYDQSGRLVKELSVDNNFTLHDISELQSGCYHLYYKLTKNAGSESLIIL